MPVAARSRHLFVIGVLFFVFGFVTWLSSVLIPYLKIACELNNFESYLVAFSFYISYLVMALPAGWLLKRTGYKKGMVIGLLLMMAGALLFIPAALQRTYYLFLLGLFVQGSGLAVLQVAANPFVTILGPRESAARRMSIMGICNGVAGAIAPLILGAVILQDADAVQQSLASLSTGDKQVQLQLLAHKVILPYACMGAVLLLLAAFIYFSPLPEPDASALEEESNGVAVERPSIFYFPHFWTGVLALFLYVGVEVIAADTIINYGASQGISLSTAKFFTSCTLCGMLVGYVIGIICIPAYVSQQKALMVSAIAGSFFALAALFTQGSISIAFIALLGLANAMVWPAIWPLALEGLGLFTKTASAILIMAIGGGAVLPLLYGHLADRFSPHQAYWMVIPCYGFILFFAVKGSRYKPFVSKK